ncbi:major facilitator superfamily domain-containing protein [Melanogaster broomeanus]|nr:major facilitator superfamily domain-containing protein [Melanogaster broomeanus]
MDPVTPRASGFWTVLTSSRAASFNEELEDDGRTPLDKTIDRIGMGACSVMWMQAIAITLPRVQQHYSVPDNYIGTLVSSMFAGMMVGAVGWGACSDLKGRIAAFNATLFFTSLFGILASFASSFRMLCALLFLLGSAVGGSMPTDGTLLLEHMPKGKEYLVTALSVFFSLGSVLSAIVALFVLPKHSCSPNQPCDSSISNNGWKYMLACLGLITLSMFLARILFFRLHESPRYLVHAGRHQEALETLQLISQFNGSEIPIDLEDVDDRRPEPQSQANGSLSAGERAPFLPPARESAHADSEILFDEGADGNPAGTGTAPGEGPGENGVKDYQSVEEGFNSLDPYPTHTPIDAHPQEEHSSARRDIPSSSQIDTADADFKNQSTVRHGRYRSTRFHRLQKRFCGVLPRWISRPLIAWLDRVVMVLSPEWFRTTVLVWGAWFFMSLAFTMFNVYYPKLLETGSTGDGPPSKSLEDNLRDVVIFALGGCPGPIVGAYMVETSLGRRGSLAASTLLTAVFCVMFVNVQSPLLVRVSSVGISLSATVRLRLLNLRYLVIDRWTPEIFGTKVRGTACGIASALSRIGGMIAPLVGGALLVMDRSVPVYTSVVVFLITAACILLLHETAGQGGEFAFVH